LSNVKISALPTGTSLVDTDTIPVVRAGVTTGVNTGTLVSDVATLKGSSPFVSPIQGRLQVDSTTQVSLQRYQGALIPIKKSGIWQNSTIPSSGPTLANTGLTAATLYYIYAFDSSGTLTLEASTTTHAVDSDSGVEIKSGDATRTLVGMVYMGAGTPGTFVDSVTSRTCVNWANRQRLDMLNAFSTNRTTTSVTWTEINAEIELTFLAWASEAIHLAITGTASNGSNGQATGTAITIDSTSSPLVTSAHTQQAAAAGQRGAIALTYLGRVNEGKHFATLLGQVSGGTATWYSTDSVATDGSAKVRLWGITLG
jgi:hypothetical protein